MKTYEFEYLSEIKLKEGSRRTNYFNSTIDFKEGDNVVVEKVNRGIFLGRIVKIYEAVECSGDYICIGIAGEVVSTYVDTVEKKKKKEALAKEMEAKFEEIDKERKFEYYATLDKEFGALFKAYKEL